MGMLIRRCLRANHVQLARHAQVNDQRLAAGKSEEQILAAPVSAHDLARAWPAARLTMVPDAGHSAMEPGIRQALVAAMEGLKAVLR